MITSNHLTPFYEGNEGNGGKGNIEIINDLNIQKLHFKLNI